MKLLLVEDNPLFAEQMTDAMHGLDGDWQVIEFSEGLAAKAWIDQCSTPVDLVLVDLGLPDGRGEALISEILVLARVDAESASAEPVDLNALLASVRDCHCGLARLGSDPFDILRRNIPGYRLLREDAEVASPAFSSSP